MILNTISLPYKAIWSLLALPIGKRLCIGARFGDKKISHFFINGKI
jgi:hypothetical protein